MLEEVIYLPVTEHALPKHTNIPHCPNSHASEPLFCASPGCTWNDPCLTYEETQGSEMLSNLPKITQLLSNGAQIPTQLFLTPEPELLFRTAIDWRFVLDLSSLKSWVGVWWESIRDSEKHCYPLTTIAYPNTFSDFQSPSCRLVRLWL